MQVCQVCSHVPPCHDISCVWGQRACFLQVPTSVLRLVVAGSTCTAWSRMGKKREWSAFSAIVFMVWAVSTLSARPDFILHECTEDFDVATLELVFSALYLITSFVFSPRDLGIPASRPRRYSILVLRARFEPTVQYALEGFGNMFFRRLQCNGHAYWTAPVARVDAMVQTMASKKGLPSTQPDGSQWPIREVMSSSKHTKLLGYERLCGKTRRRLQYIVNIHQTSAHCHGLSDIVPCLMTATSTVWSMTHNRMLIPLEHLCVQGIPVFTPFRGQRYAVERMGLAGTMLRGQHIVHLAGNGMHLSAVGSVLMFMLGSVHCVLDDTGGIPQSPFVTSVSNAGESDDEVEGWPSVAQSAQCR